MHRSVGKRRVGSPECFDGRKKHFLDGSPYHIETSPLIYRANQWTGFYIIGTSVIRVKGVECCVKFRLPLLSGFQNICNESTEFHFQNIDNQLCIIEQNLKNRPERSRTLRTSSLLNKSQQNRTTNLLQTG